jgi:ubiquinone/menaquinone biosynthesis C-methylase UbiE
MAAEGPGRMDFFDRQWRSYRAIVDHDLMEHRAVAAATAAAVEPWLAARPAGAAPPTWLDLGCGDLALLAPLLQRLPLGHYTGLDLAEAVLPLAQRNLGAVPYPTHWCSGDLLAWSQGDGADAAGAEEDQARRRPDVLHSAFAIHHLDDPQKQQFLEGARRRIAPGGLFLWVDVFRNAGEARQAYIDRYVQRIRSGWQPLSAEQREHVETHLRSFDLPAERGRIEAMAEAAGWRWHWAWQGAHQAEAMAVLTPA